MTGNLKTILFDQADNIPMIEDGNKLFKRMTELTSLATLQLSMLSFNNILHFDLAQYDFKIPIINTKLSQLFVLATTRECQLSQEEGVQHALAVYSRIKQPEEWAQWVCNQVEEFENGNINNCQDFLNSAAVRFARIYTLQIMES